MPNVWPIHKQRPNGGQLPLNVRPRARPPLQYIAPQLLLTLLEQSNEGRWETITADFGIQSMNSFTSRTFNK
jgi:hypothetical protein